MVFGIYCRKSVLTDKGESVGNQLEICRSYIFSRFGGENDILVYEDEGYSGKNTSRPMFIQLTEDIKKQKLDYVVCYRLDRISRSVSDFSAFVEMINKYRTGLICVREEFDTSRPVGKAMMYMASVFSQLERETIGERVRDNMIMLARDGRWLGGNTPLGYDSVKVPYQDASGRTKTAAYLKENNKLKNVQKIYETFLKCHDCRTTAERMNSLGLRTARGKAFTAGAIRDIIKNPVYCRADGTALEYFKERNIEVFGEASKNGLISYNKGTDGGEVTAVGRHRPAVSGSVWVRAQKILEGTDIFEERSLKRGRALASGAVICGRCGGRMYAVARSGGKEFDYICKNKRNKSGCNVKNLKGSKADEKIRNFMGIDKDGYMERLSIREGLKIVWDGERLDIERKGIKKDIKSEKET